MNVDVKKFIEEHIDLIEDNQWEEVYDKLKIDVRGEFTQIMLEASIDALKSLDYIPDGYLNNADITSFEVPKGIKRINDHAFFACRNLQEFIIPNSVEYIGAFVFGKCPLLKEIIYVGTKREWRAIPKSKMWRTSSYVEFINCSDGYVTLKSKKY